MISICVVFDVLRRDYFGLTDDFPRNQLKVRGQEQSKKSRIYLLSSEATQLLDSAPDSLHVSFSISNFLPLFLSHCLPLSISLSLHVSVSVVPSPPFVCCVCVCVCVCVEFTTLALDQAARTTLVLLCLSHVTCNQIVSAGRRCFCKHPQESAFSWRLMQEGVSAVEQYITKRQIEITMEVIRLQFFCVVETFYTLVKLASNELV